MTITLRELAELVEGRLVGDGEITISGAAILRDARRGDITLADNAKLAPQLAGCQASAAVVNAKVVPHALPHIAVDDVHRSFAKILTHLRPQRTNLANGIDPSAHADATAIVAATAYIGPSAQVGPRVILGENVSVGARCVIHGGAHVMAGSHIADDCEIFPNVVLYENTILGPRVVFHAGSVIGAYGFGY
jgi:UDP-3-O-[3-hydroxymyristoyl] glucosamine N-acyltransferase